MKRFSFVTAVFLCLAVISCSSVGMKGTKPREDSPVAVFFAEKDVTIRNGVITLQDDIRVDESIVLNTGELWTINLNGYFIRCLSEQPCFRILDGGLIVEDRRDEGNNYFGMIESYYGTGIFVGGEGSLELSSGEIRGDEYAVEIDTGGVMKVTGGALIGMKLPVFGHDGWQGEFSGGFFNDYDESYMAALAGRSYISTQQSSIYKDYFNTFENGFEIAGQTLYFGTSEITLTANENRDACYRMYRPYDLYDYFGQRVKPYYQWFVKAGGKETFSFLSGEYVIMAAEGFHWNEEDAYGPEGRYWKMVPYEFKDKYAYSIKTGGEQNMLRQSDQQDFLTGPAKR